MKNFAAKQHRPQSATRGKSSPVHAPPSARLRAQRATIHRIVQPKVKVGQPNDRFEQEADRVADRVVGNQPVADISSVSNGFSSLLTRPVQAAQGTEELPEEEEIQREVEEQEPVQARLLQRQPEEEEV